MSCSKGMYDPRDGSGCIPCFGHIDLGDNTCRPCAELCFSSKPSRLRLCQAEEVCKAVYKQALEVTTTMKTLIENILQETIRPTASTTQNPIIQDNPLISEWVLELVLGLILLAVVIGVVVCCRKKIKSVWRRITKKRGHPMVVQQQAQELQVIMQKPIQESGDQIEDSGVESCSSSAERVFQTEQKPFIDDHLSDGEDTLPKYAVGPSNAQPRD